MTKYTTVGVSVYHPKGHLVATCDCSERADDVAVALSKLESKGAGPVRDDVVPGKMHCAKCKFSVIRNVLNLGNGSITTKLKHVQMVVVRWGL